jgi:8-amino-7-oxononanoate synthase
MSLRPSAFGLSREVRSQLLERLASRRTNRSETTAPARVSARALLGDPQVREELQRIRDAGRILGIDNPFFRPHDGIAGAETSI